jgi:hypothetical protein
MPDLFRVLAGAALLVAASAIASAQDTPPRLQAASPVKTAADYPAPQTYPNEKPELIAEHLSKARKLAGTDLFQDMAHRCIISPRFPLRVNGIQYPGKIIPTKLFVNFY